MSDQGGKARLKMDGGEMQIQRQLAALLLMPKPIRADDAMGSGSPILRHDEYAIESVEVSAAETGATEFVLMPSAIELRNATEGVTVDASTRYRRVRALWSNAARFPPSVRDALMAHREAVAAGGPLGEAEESAVEALVAGVGGDPVDLLDRVPTDLVAALCSKPFVILTGPTGTGKSRSAIELAMWLDYGAGLPPHLAASRTPPSTALAFIPVGADWTDQRNLLGFRNPFGPQRVRPSGETTNLTFEVTPLVRLLLRASHVDFRDDPHFVVLDEMNLSHVERYFSTFLSILEADRSVGESGRFELLGRDDLALIAEVLAGQGTAPIEMEAAEQLVAANSGLGFPPNVFILGTVNVDETTYMFSPKVLDRAFVRELEAPDPTAVLRGASSTAQTAPGAAVLEAFQETIGKRRSGRPLATTTAELTTAAEEAGLTPTETTQLAETVQRALAGSFKLLSPVGFGFGYRVLQEVVEYVSVELSVADAFGRDTAQWAELVDAAVLMKLLPKIHGNRRKLGDSIAALAAFLDGGQAPPASYSLGGAPAVAIEPGEKLRVALPKSARKAQELHRTLQATGYTTFIS